MTQTSHVLVVAFIIGIVIGTANDSMMSESPRSIQCDVITFIVDNSKKIYPGIEAVDGPYHRFDKMGIAENKIAKPVMGLNDEWKWIHTWVHEENVYYLHFYQHVFQQKDHWRIFSNESETIFETEVSTQSLPDSSLHPFPDVIELHYVSDRQIKRLVERRQCSQVLRWKKAKLEANRESMRQPKKKKSVKWAKPSEPVRYWSRRPNKNPEKTLTHHSRQDSVRW